MAGELDLEAVVDELLALPPKQFTEARNAAAKRLLADGHGEAAGEIKQVPRPPVALWSLNRLAHAQPDLVETFLDAAQQLRKAYASGGDVRAATPPEREAEARIVAGASEFVRAEGAKVTETITRGIRQTLAAAAADSEIAATLRAGRLIREPEAPSLDQILNWLPQGGAAGTAAKAPPRRDRQAERLALRDEISSAQSDAAEARDAAREAADAARAAEREWRRATKVAEGAQQRSDSASERVQELQERLKEL